MDPQTVVDNLRRWADDDCPLLGTLDCDISEAADLIEQQAAEIARLRLVVLDLTLAETHWQAERALADKVAEALRVAWTAAERSTPFHADDRKWTLDVAKPMTFAALAAHEAARKEQA